MRRPAFRRPTIWLGLYRRLLRLYPRSLRRELGAEMEGLFLGLHAEARLDGRWPALWLCLRASSEVLPRAFQAHGDPESPTGAYLVQSFFSDLRFAWQAATRQPRYSAVVVATMAIGIAATTTVFSVTDAAIIRRLPFPDAERLVEVMQHNEKSGFSFYGLAADSLMQLSDQEHLFDFVGGVDTSRFVVEVDSEPREMDGARISPELLSVLGARPVVGRVFAAEEAAAGALPVALVSERLWRQRFGAVEELSGITIALDDVDHEVVGVLPRGFAFPYSRTDVWTPGDALQEGARMRAYARLTPGLEVEEARERIGALDAVLPEGFEEDGWALTLVALDSSRAGRDTRFALWLALGAAGLLLLVACVNVTQVAFARSIRREAELSVRAALGAGRGRIIRQALIENLIMSAAGGLVGLVLARWLVSLINATAPDDLVHLDAIQFSVEWRAFAFAALLAATVGVLAGLLPAWSTARVEVASTLRGSKVGLSASRHRRRLQSGLIAVEATLCVVLLAGAGLLLSSFSRLASEPPGFDAEHLISVTLSLDAERYPTPEARRGLLEEYARRIEGIPGVEGALPAGSSLPMPGGVRLASKIETDAGPPAGIASAPGGNGQLVSYGLVTTGYFDLVGVNLLRGRAVDARDHGTNNVVVTDDFASYLFGEGDALGRTFTVEEGDSYRIVGIASATRSFSPAVSVRDWQMYMGLYQAESPRQHAGVIVRTAEPDADIAAQLERALWDVDERQAVSRIEPGSSVVDDWVVTPRFYSLLLGTFAGVALLLVLVGVSGVVAQAVAARTREIGIRVALGATHGRILRLALAGGLRPALLGLGLGVVAAWLGARLMESMLYGIEPTDPRTFLVVIAVFLAVTFLASYIPARRALQVNPVRALRAD